MRLIGYVRNLFIFRKATEYRVRRHLESKNPTVCGSAHAIWRYLLTICPITNSVSRG
jgi:hypothetical protein